MTAQDGVPLWNFSGPYVLPYGAAHLYQDSRGKIACSYDTLGMGSMSLVGAISGSGADLKMRLKSATGVPELLRKDDLDFFPISVTREDKLSLAFDANASTLSGTDRISRTSEEIVLGSPNSWRIGNKTYIRRSTSVSIERVAMTVPDSANGNWTLSLEIVPTGNKLSGAAAIAFSNGEIFRFQILGRYSTKTGKTTLLLKGDGVDKGASLLLCISGPDMEIQSMHGAVGGQRIHFRSPLVSDRPGAS
jgi:hypothetical protein